MLAIAKTNSDGMYTIGVKNRDRVLVGGIIAMHCVGMAELYYKAECLQRYALPKRIISPFLRNEQVNKNEQYD